MKDNKYISNFVLWSLVYYYYVHKFRYYSLQYMQPNHLRTIDDIVMKKIYSNLKMGSEVKT